MEFINIKPRSIGLQFNIEKLANEMRAQGHNVLVVSAKTKSNTQTGRAMTSSKLLAMLRLINNGQEE